MSVKPQKGEKPHQPCGRGLLLNAQTASIAADEESDAIEPSPIVSNVLPEAWNAQGTASISNGSRRLDWNSKSRRTNLLQRSHRHLPYQRQALQYNDNRRTMAHYLLGSIGRYQSR